MGRDYHVTGGHETEAKAAQRAKKPSRLGVFVLRLLGHRGTPSLPPWVRGSSPGREHRNQ